MTYRFAFAAFWSAVAIADVELPPPVDNLGTVKGLLLRHLRWWRQHEDMFNADGVMNIGFTYPNMYLSELYNSPQSVYWCLKGFVALLRPQDSAFWRSEELPHPLARDDTVVELSKVLRAPQQIVDGSPVHHYLLSSGQMTTMPHKAKDAKYSKFAYSSAFGFSVPTEATTLGQMAPDSTLSVSIDGGGSWRVRDESTDVRVEAVTIGDEHVDGLTSLWKPWAALDLQIETTLVALTRHVPGWHLRFHRIRWSERTEAALLADAIQLVDGGFAIPATTAEGLHVPEASSWDDFTATDAEGHYSDGVSALIQSKAGAGGTSNLSHSEPSSTAEVQSDAFVLNADPNTNLLSPRTFIPCVRHSLTQKKTGTSSQREAWLTTGVFAVVAGRVAPSKVRELWEKKSRVVIRAEEAQGKRFKVETSG